MSEDQKIRRTLNIKDEVSVGAASLPSLEDFMPPQTMGYSEKSRKAFDACLAGSGFEDMINPMALGGAKGVPVTPQFLGYQFLSTLTQSGLIRAACEIKADSMTEAGIELRREGESPYSEMITVDELKKEWRRFNLDKVLNKCVMSNMQYGGCLLYPDFGASAEELEKKEYWSSFGFRKNSLKRFTVVEPVSLYPGLYNSYNPLSPDYYKPVTWYVMNKEIHASRFIYFAPNELPVLLRPSFNFFGIGLAQTILDAFSHFTECREAAARLLTKFSDTILKTDLDEILFGGKGSVNELKKRIALYVQERSNDGVNVIDKEEDIIKLDTTIAGVADLVRQAMEILSAYAQIPAVVFWTISPNGFNATGLSDFKVFNAHIKRLKQKQLPEQIQQILNILMLNKWGVIDKTITFEFNEVSVDDELVQSQIEKAQSETDAIDMQNGVLSPQEVRKQRSENPKSRYSGIDPEDVPELPGEEFENYETQNGFNNEPSPAASVD